MKIIICPLCKIELELKRIKGVYICPNCEYTCPVDLVHSEELESEENLDEEYENDGDYENEEE